MGRHLHFSTEFVRLQGVSLKNISLEEFEERKKRIVCGAVSKIKVVRFFNYHLFLLIHTPLLYLSIFHVRHWNHMLNFINFQGLIVSFGMIDLLFSTTYSFSIACQRTTNFFHWGSINIT